jgi:hypothetical protein
VGGDPSLYITGTAAPRGRVDFAVPNTPTTIIDETIAAARGVASLLVGDRRAAGHFDFSPRGVVGSFIALLVALAVGVYMPLPVGDDAAAMPSSTQEVLIDGLVFALQLGVAALLLRLLKRQDGFVPYLVAGNWANFYASIAAVLLTLVGVSPDATIIFFVLVLIVFEINTARLLMTLAPRQIILFLGGQVLIVGFIGLIAIGLFVPPGTLPSA